MKPPWRVFDRAASTATAPKNLPLSLLFTMTRGGGNPELERFYLQISIESTRRLSDYCVDVEFPSAFLNASTTYGPEVRELRTSSHLVLRATPENYTKILNPGRNDLQGIEFFIRRDGSQRESMNEVVRAITYYEDNPTTLEHSIAELCDKNNPLVFRES